MIDFLTLPPHRPSASSGHLSLKGEEISNTIMRIGIDMRMAGTHHGGIGRYVFELVKNLLEIDLENEYVLFYNPESFEKAEELKNLPVKNNIYLIKAPFRHYSFKEQLFFSRLLDKHSLDLVHFPNFNFPILYKKPFVVTIHDMVHHKIGGAKKTHFIHFLAYKKVIEAAAKNSKKIITVSEYSKTEIEKYLQVNPSKIEVIYEGSSLKTDASEIAVAEVKKQFLLTRPYFLFVGVLERKKNLVNLTRGFDAFLKKYKLDMDLVIVGKSDKHYPDIKYKAMDIKHKDRLVFTGYLGQKDLEAMYKGAHALVNSSLHEGFGLPGVEAMQFGLPLAVSNLPVFNEIYDNAAVYFDPLDPEDIAEKLYLLARDSSFYHQLQINSHKRGQEFTWRKTAEQTLKVFKEAI